MPVVEVWYCSECGDGPKVWESQTVCVACKHERCEECTVRRIHQMTPDFSLHTAVKEDDIGTVLPLLINGADVNMLNSNSETPLHIAIEHENVDMMWLLLRHGADANAKNPNLDTPLHIVIENEFLDMNHMIDVLLEMGADINIPGKDGMTTLMMALEKRLHGVVKQLLEAGALLRETIRRQVVSEHNGSQVTELGILLDRKVFHFVENEWFGVEDLRKAVTLTGSVHNAQMMSCEDYVAQTWGDSGLKVLDTLFKIIKKKAILAKDSFDGQQLTFEFYRGKIKITVEASQNQIVDLMEQIAWLGCAFAGRKAYPHHGLFLATGYYSFSASRCCRLSIEEYFREKYSDEPCWTTILRSTTLAVGFPVRNRPEGLVGLEIPFPLLLRFADISVSMEYDGGTLLVGASTILFPSRKLEDGIQWHVTDATSAQDAIGVIDRSPDWIRTNDIGQLAELRAYLGYCSHAQILLGTRELIMSQPAIESSRPLPKARSQIELAHEGTMSAGFSIRGIFNATVGGKWIVPPALNVSLEEFRDVYDLILNASRRPILIYNNDEDRGWLVPELSLIVHMALTYLHQPDIRQRCLASVQEALPYLSASARVWHAYDIVKGHWKLELYEKFEDGQMKTFGMVIYDFIKDLQKLRTAENIRRASKGRRFTFPVFASRSLRGWDFPSLS